VPPTHGTWSQRSESNRLHPLYESGPSPFGLTGMEAAGRGHPGIFLLTE